MLRLEFGVLRPEQHSDPPVIVADPLFASIAAALYKTTASNGAAAVPHLLLEILLLHAARIDPDAKNVIVMATSFFSLLETRAVTTQKGRDQPSPSHAPSGLPSLTPHAKLRVE